MKKLLTVSQAAKYLGVSIDTIRRWGKSGKITSLRTAGGARRFTKEMLDAVKNGKQNSISEQGLTVSEAAKRLGVTTMTIRRWDEAGKIRVDRDKANYRRISTLEINRLLTKEITGKEEGRGEVPLTSPTLSPLVPTPLDGSRIARRLATTLLFAGMGMFLIAMMTFAQKQNITKGISEGLISLIKGDSDIQDMIAEIINNRDQKVLGGGTENYENLENLELTDNYYPLTAYGQNLLKNPSFETVKGQQAAFWQYHPNSTQDNTTLSELYPHSGSKTLLLHDANCISSLRGVATRQSGSQTDSHSAATALRNDNPCSMGVIQEATKTEARRNYELGIWVKTNKQFSNTNFQTQIHLALGPGYDRSFTVNGDNKWHYYSTRFEFPPPGLVPRIYATNLHSEDFLFLDDGYFGETSAMEGSHPSIAGIGGTIITGFNTLLPTAGGVLSVTAQGILYPTNASETAGGLGLESQRFGKFYGSEADLSGSLLVGQNANVRGTLNADGAVTLGNESGDNIDVKGSFVSDLIPKADGTYSLGTNDIRWKNEFVDALTVTNNVAIGGTLTVGGGVAGSGGLTVSGDLSLDGDLDFTGAQNITTTADNLTISPTGNLVIDTSGGTVAVRDNLTVNGTSSLGDGGTTNYLLVSNTGDVTLYGTANNISANNDLVIKSGNSLTLDTSASNSELRIQTGSGTLSASTGIINLSSSGTTTFTSGGNMSLYSSGELYLDDQWTTNAIPFSQSGQSGLSTALTSTSIVGALNEIAGGQAGIWIDSNGATAGGTVSLNDQTSNWDVDTSGTIALDTTNTFTIGSSNDATAALTLKAASGGITLSAMSSDNGELRLLSGGTLTLDTSRFGAPIYLQGGITRIGSGGTADYADGNGDLYVSGVLEVDGSIYLGDSSVDNLIVLGEIASDLIPTTGSAYDLGSTTKRWKEGFIDDLTVSNFYVSSTNINSTASTSFTINASNATADLQDSSYVWERGTGFTNVSLMWDASEKYMLANMPWLIQPGNDIIGLSGESAILNVDDTIQGRRLLTLKENGTAKFIVDSSGNILLPQASTIETSSGALTLKGYNGITLTTSSASTGEIRVISRGTLQLDTSTNNTNIKLMAGTGSIQLSAGNFSISGSMSTPYDNTYVVAKSGGDFVSINDAIAKINNNNDASSTVKYTIQVMTGTYTENIIVPIYTTILGQGLSATIIDGQVTLNDGSVLKNLRVFPSTDAAQTIVVVSQNNTDVAWILESYIVINNSLDSPTYLFNHTGASDLRVYNSFLYGRNPNAGASAATYIAESTATGGDIEIQSDHIKSSCPTNSNCNLAVNNSTSANSDIIFTGISWSVFNDTSPVGAINNNVAGGRIKLDVSYENDNSNHAFYTTTGSNVMIAPKQLGNTSIALDNGFTSGTGLSMAFPVSTTLAGALTGISLDLSSNVIDGDNQVKGINLTLPDSGTATTYGLYITGDEANYFSGNVGIGTTAPLYSLDVSGGTRVIGNAGVILRAGTSSINLSSGTTSTTADIELAAADQMDLFASKFSLTTSNTVNGEIRLSSAGSITLDTSRSNGNILLQAGTGSILGSATTMKLTGNLDITGTETFNGITYTFPGTQSANGVLTTNGSGSLSWATLGSSSITADSLDFTEFKDEMTLDADTSINGDYSLILRAGLGSIQNSSSGNNDLQLAAEDKLILAANSFDLMTSSGAIDIISGSYLDLSSKGTLTLDTSQNNTNILLLPGGGNVGIGTTGPTGLLEVFQSGTGRTRGQLLVNGADVTIGQLSSTGGDNTATYFVNRVGSTVMKVYTTDGQLQLLVADAPTMPAYSFLNDPNTGMYSPSADVIRFTTAGLPRVTIKDDGNVGIGLTNPAGIMDVLGQCVTGDTVLMRRRRRRRRGKNGEWIEEEYFEPIRIDQIHEGDEILTLDEHTGKFVVQRVEKKMEKGVQAVFRLTTESSKQIETTSEHPYLTLEDNKKASVSRSFFDSNSPLGGHRTYQETVYQACQKLSSLKWTGGESNPRSRNDKSISPARARPTCSFYQKPSWKKVSLLKPGMLIATIDGWERIKSIIMTGRKQVYDLSIAATHNFVANGIVAHNTSGILMRAGASSLQLSSSATSTTADIELAAADQMDLFASKFSLTTSSLTNGEIRLSSAGSVTLDTSRSNGNILLQAGTGSILGSATTMKLTGNLDITGTETFNGITYTFPGTQSANGVLTTNGSGSLSWATLGSSSITADSLDFTEFKDEMTLDADTSINGDYSLILRAGLGSIQNSSSGNNDLQLAAEDKLILAANSFDLMTSSGAIDMISGSYLDLSSKGTLTLDTSQNNANILLLTGTGNVGIGTTSPLNQLHVYGGGSAESKMRIGNNGAYDASIYFNTNADWTIGVDNSNTNAFTISNGSALGSGDRVTITTAGNVGIGTTTPNELLEVSGSSGAIRLTDTNTAGVGRFRFYENSTNIGDVQFVGSTHAVTAERNWMEFVNRTATGGVSFWTNSTQQMSINSSGNVGIGTTGPTYKLEVAGAGTDDVLKLSTTRNIGSVAPLLFVHNRGIANVADGDSIAFMFQADSDTTASAIGSYLKVFSEDVTHATRQSGFGFWTQNAGNLTEKVRITGTGNVGIGTTAPGVKLDVSGAIRGDSLTTTTNWSYSGLGSSIYEIAGQRYVGSDYQVFRNGAQDTIFGVISTNSYFTGSLGVGYADPGTAKLAINGNVGIGTTGPKSKLSVSGDFGGTTLPDTNSGYGLNIVKRSGIAGDFSVGDYFGLTFTTAADNTNEYGVAGVFGKVVDVVSGELHFATKISSNSVMEDRMVIDKSGNVGIGTTSPLGVLDVLGSCVTGDTLLPIRRRRRKKKYADSDDPLPTLPDVEGKAPADAFELEYLLCRIDQVLPGDEVLSLNEATGTLQYAKINKLMDMDVKEVYELITKSGRTIRTTAEHPYLVEMINVEQRI